MTMSAGITRVTEGIDNISWNILGQTYVPKSLSERAMSWHATLPKGTFVPPHIHPTQDEFLYILEGRFDLILDGAEAFAEPGDTIRLPMGLPHGIFNKTDRTIKCLFWVAPTRRLYDLFWKLHALGPTANPADVVATSAQHEVDFLPPPEA
jgi:quercetin dioxygenase-like cupin family protein